ncbi:MAG TPA: amidohydrolase [Steroidobacteraceae bacterium]|nr:amidohydrolase [Steroidobacteraceae bacterium]
MARSLIIRGRTRIAALALACECLAACAAQPSVDLIVAGDYVVTMEANADVVKDGAIVVDDGMIVAVGPYQELAARYHARTVIDGDGRVVLPGLINGHTHAAMTLLRGIADDRELIDWLNNYIFPTERRFVDAEFVRVGTELACWEMIRGGTTTFVDMYYFPDSVARAIESCGLRVLVGPSVIDQKSPDAANADESLRLASEFVTRWKGKNNRIVPIIAAHAIYTLKPEQLVAARAKAQELGVPISIHISESRFEVDYSQKTFGTTPVNHLEALDFFKGPTIGAHLVWPTSDEIPILARRHVGVIHNATSNMKISSGISPVAQMLKEGVAVGLGTDGAATNNDLDMWEEIRLAAFLQKVATMDPQVVPARTALNMATLGGAQAIGLDQEIGALTVGRRADFIQVSLSDLHFTPMYDVISHLVYVADEQDVRTVVVDGKVLMREGKVLTVDEQRVRSEAEAIAARIRAEVVDRKPRPVKDSN